MDDNIVATPLVGGESEICGKDAKILNINMGNEPNGVQKSETVYNPLVSAEVEEVHESVLASRLEDTSAWATDIFQLKRTGGNKVNEKNIKLGRLSIILLFTLGVAAGLINGCILMANHALCKFQAQLVVTGGYFGIGLLYFMIAMSVSVMLAAMGCHYGAKAAAGSGLPEFKYLLASELRRSDYEKLISLRIFIFKVFGLIFSVGGGLSVGSEGPLVHTVRIHSIRLLISSSLQILFT